MFEAAAAQQPAPTVSPVHKKSPALAFLISLLVPGLGQVYCGKRFRGTVAFVVFATSAYFVVSDWPSVEKGVRVWLVACSFCIPIHIFAFLDAYLTAREINTGIDAQVDVQNPRVAAALNFFTNGLGYFYLGERKTGLTVFLVLMFVNGSIYQNAPALFALVIPTIMAVHAYTIATKQVREALGEEELRAAENAIRQNTPLAAAVPLTLAAMCALLLIAIFTVSSLLPKSVDQSGAGLGKQTAPDTYANLQYGVVTHIPSNWEFDTSVKNEIVGARRQEGGCVLELTAVGALPLRSLKSETEVLADDMLNADSRYKLLAYGASNLGKHDAREVRFALTINGNNGIQRFILARSGLTVYMLIVTMASPPPQGCEEEVSWIRNNLEVGN